MASLVSFVCAACGAELPKPEPALPAWARFIASDALRWSSAQTPTAANFMGPWPWPDRAPQPGDEHLIRVESPFAYGAADATPWLLFQPDRSAWNGWGYAPEEIPLSSFCRVSLLAIVNREASSAWLRVRTEEVMALPELTLLPLSDAPEPPALTLLADAASSRLERARAGDYAYFAYSADGDLGEWAVCHDDGGSWDLLLQGDWGFHSDLIYAGRRRLTSAEMAGLGISKP